MLHFKWIAAQLRHIDGKLSGGHDAAPFSPKLPQSGDSATRLSGCHHRISQPYFVFILKYPLLLEIHLLPLISLGVNLINAHLTSSPVMNSCWAQALLSANHLPSILPKLFWKAVMFIIFIAILIASCYSPAPLPFSVIPNLLTTAARHWTATGTLIILQSRPFLFTSITIHGLHRSYWRCFSY